MYEFVELLIDYYEKGASWLRVDAVAFLWKKIGTTCIHLEETHTAVKLFRCVAELLSPGYKLLTETNVPLAENLSYFGDGDEAHIVYNFFASTASAARSAHGTSRLSDGLVSIIT